MMLLPFVVPRTPIWQTAATQTFTSDDASWAGFTVRMFIPQASLSVMRGSAVRVTVTAPSANGFAIDGMYIGQAAAGYTVTAPSFNATPTQITFNSGSASLAMSAGAGTKLSDVIVFAPPSANGIILSWHYTAAVASQKFTGANSPANWKTSHKGASSEAATVSVTGYTDDTGTEGGVFANLVEFFA